MRTKLFRDKTWGLGSQLSNGVPTCHVQGPEMDISIK
jgi:hypothetical protein